MGKQDTRQGLNFLANNPKVTLAGKEFGELKRNGDGRMPCRDFMG
jgi:hypothetical protein